MELEYDVENNRKGRSLGSQTTSSNMLLGRFLHKL